MQHEYMQVAGAMGLPEMKRTKITMSRSSVSEPEKINALLQRFLEFPGWVCFQNAVVTLPADRLPNNLGYPLSAEVAGNSTSFRILPDGQGGWTVSSVDESEQGEMEVLYDCVQHIGNHLAPGALQYRRYWRKDDDNGYVAFAARFTGYSKEGA